MLANPPSHPPKARLFDFIDDVVQRYQMMNAGGIIHSLNPQPCLPGAQLTDRLDRIHTDLLQLPRYRLTDVGQLCQFSHLLLMTRLGAEFGKGNALDGGTIGDGASYTQPPSLGYIRKQPQSCIWIAAVIGGEAGI